MSDMSDEKYADKWPEMRMKHLELLQGVISRMANQSANLKNYCMTLVAGIIGLSVAVQKPDALLYAMPVVLVFAALDANYLKLERAFRAQYNSVRKEPIDQASDFLITPGWETGRKWYESLWSWSVFWFYAPLVVILGVIYYLMS